MSSRSNAFRIRQRPSAVAAFGVFILLLAGCAGNAPDGEPNSGQGGQQPAQQEETAEAGLSSESIIAAVEAQGLECADEDPRMKDRAQLIVCKGDNYVIITATRLVDADLVDEQIIRAKKAVCTSSFKIDGTRFAVSGAWVLAPGGSDDRNVEAFDAAMQNLGVSWSLDPC